jgi:hypothetical protein
LIVGELPKARGMGTRKVEIGTATGPSAAVSVAAASTADFSITISPELKNVDAVVVIAVSGLPANVSVSQIGFSGTSVTLRALNPTGSAISIAAGSLTITYLVIGW